MEGGEKELNKKIEYGEVRRALTRMKNNKAAAADGLKAEFLKGLPPSGIDELTDILNEMFDKGE